MERSFVKCAAKVVLFFELCKSFWIFFCIFAENLTKTMMNRILIAVALCLTGVSGWGRLAFTEKNFADTIQFRYDDMHRIMVPVVIGGRTYEFQFDSGATTCAIPLEAADVLLGSELKDMKTRGAFDTKSTKHTRHGLLKEMAIGGLHLSGAECVAVENAQYLFGAHLLYYNGYRYKIDLRARQLIITDRKDLFREEIASAYSLPVKIMGRGTSLGFSLSHGVKGTAIFDTGNGDFFDVSEKYYDECFHGRDSVEFRRQTVYADSTGMMDFKSRVHRTEQVTMRIEALRLGDLTFANAPVRTALNYTGFGCRMLEYGCVVVDGRNYSVYFEPYGCKDGVVEMNEYIAPLFFGLKDDRIVVKGIDQKSQAYADGVRTGDFILEVNGRPCQTAKEFGALVGVLNVAESITVTVRTGDGTMVETNLLWR